VHLREEACAQLDAGQLAELASQAKHHAKHIPGYSLHVIDTLNAGSLDSVAPAPGPLPGPDRPADTTATT
jgi:hypothetical protein